MPYGVKKDGESYTVVNTATGQIKATHTTEEDAERQVRLLHMIEKGE